MRFTYPIPVPPAFKAVDHLVSTINDRDSNPVKLCCYAYGSFKKAAELGSSDRVKLVYYEAERAVLTSSRRKNNCKLAIALSHHD